jgi:hypothetical protein
MSLRKKIITVIASKGSITKHRNAVGDRFKDAHACLNMHLSYSQKKCSSVRIHQMRWIPDECAMSGRFGEAEINHIEQHQILPSSGKSEGELFL